MIRFLTVSNSILGVAAAMTAISLAVAVRNSQAEEKPSVVIKMIDMPASFDPRDVTPVSCIREIPIRTLLPSPEYTITYARPTKRRV